MKTKATLKPLYIVTTNFHGSSSIAMSSSFYNTGYATEKAARAAARLKAEQMTEQYVHDMMTARLAPLSETEARKRVAVEESPMRGPFAARLYNSAAHDSLHAVCYFGVEKITPAT